MPDELASFSLQAIASLFATNSSIMTGELLDACVTAVTSLLNDECYPARLAGGHLVQVFFRQFSDAAAVFNDLKVRLSLHSTSAAPRHNARERVETSLIMLGALPGRARMPSCLTISSGCCTSTRSYLRLLPLQARRPRAAAV